MLKHLFQRQVLRGNGQYPWLRPMVDITDLLVQHSAEFPVRATCFGGPHDAGDTGSTASGFSTRQHPARAACALPLANRTQSTQGSPIPGNLKWGLDAKGQYIHGGTIVRVYGPLDHPHVAARTIDIPLIDIGPSITGEYATQNAIDLTPGAMIALGFSYQPDDPELTNLSCHVSYRILQGALAADAWVEQWEAA